MSEPAPFEIVKTPEPDWAENAAVSRWKLRKRWLMGCGVMLALGWVAAVAVGLWLKDVLLDPRGVLVEIEAPLEMNLHETASISVRVLNRRSKDDIVVDHIDIDTVYLKGFKLLAIEPSGAADYAISHNVTSFPIATAIPSGDELRLSLTLKAVTEGAFVGDVDVWEDERFTTRVLQTIVWGVD